MTKKRVSIRELEEESERIYQHNIQTLQKNLNMDERMAIKTYDSLGKAGVGCFRELKKVGEKYEYVDGEGRGYFLMKGEEVDKVVLGNVVLFENGKRLHSPKVDEE